MSATPLGVTSAGGCDDSAMSVGEMHMQLLGCDSGRNDRMVLNVDMQGRLAVDAARNERGVPMSMSMLAWRKPGRFSRIT